MCSFSPTCEAVANKKNCFRYLKLMAQNGCFLLQQVCIFCLESNEHWRAIWSEKSPCEGWLRFLVGQKRSSSRLVILKSRPMSPPARVVHNINETWYASCIHRLSTNGLSDYRENPVPINRNGLLSKKITFKILNNGYDRFQ
jgi:hypothetical protein